MQRWTDLSRPVLASACLAGDAGVSTARDQATSRSFCASASDCSFFSDWFSI